MPCRTGLPPSSVRCLCSSLLPPIWPNPYLIGLAIDRYIDRGDLGGLSVICGCLLGVSVVQWLAQYGQVWTMSWAGQGML